MQILSASHYSQFELYSFKMSFLKFWIRFGLDVHTFIRIEFLFFAEITKNKDSTVHSVLSSLTDKPNKQEIFAVKYIFVL
jgi:hypothetical protein